MHIPDGFLSPGASVALLGAAIGFMFHALSSLRQKYLVKEKKFVLSTSEGLELAGRVKTRLSRYGQERIYKMAAVAAFVFAAQMVNFPIESGTSGHLLGGVLAAILLGPLEGFLAITIVLVVQSLVFADGGLLALGANIFNMSIVGAVGGYYLYKYLRRYIKAWWVAAFVAAWASVVVAAAICSAEIAISGTSSLSSVLPAMISTHALIGIGEGTITVIVLWFMKYKKKDA